jgi:hypothetical protein
VETSAGKSLISTRPFAATKWSAWLVLKESPRLSGSKHSYTESATISYCTPCRLLLTDSTQKTPGLQKPSVPNIMRRRKQTCRNACIWSGGECNGWPVSRHEPLDTTPPPFREIGQQKDLVANLMLHVFTYCWFEMTWK